MVPAADHEEIELVTAQCLELLAAYLCRTHGHEGISVALPKHAALVATPEGT